MPPGHGPLPRRASRCRQRSASARLAGELPDTLLLLEHPPVYTRGRRSARGRAAARRGLLPRARASRSSPPTAAGASPTTAPASSSATRSCASRTSAPPAHDGGRDRRRARRARASRARARREDGPDYTGVWVEERKIASIGVHVSRGITTHGFAVNVDNDLEPFSWVVACGLPDVTMTSIAARARRRPTRRRWHAFASAMADSFCEAHGRRSGSSRRAAGHRRAASTVRAGAPGERRRRCRA